MSVDHDHEPSALKHGAFSKILFLPGENPAEFDKLRSGLISEYRPSGESEEETIEEIARAMWVGRRTGVYQHVKHLRIKAKRAANLEAFNQHRKRFGKSPIELPQTGSVNEALLDLGDILSFDYLAKELEVDAKLHAKIDRLFKRLFASKAMKQMAGLSGGQVIEGTTVKELAPPEPKEEGLPEVQSLQLLEAAPPETAELPGGSASPVIEGNPAAEPASREGVPQNGNDNKSTT
jgi:hypothetical protein